jgi:HlyD family secretion protein
MDIIKSKQHQYKLADQKHKIGIAVLICTAVVGGWFIRSSGLVSVTRNEILIEKVLQGNVDVVVDGFGTLRSNKQQLISSLTKATVKEIVLRPGAQVTTNSIVAYLENSELNEEVKGAQLQLEQAKANLRQLKLSQEREYLNELAKIDEAASNYEKVKLRRMAHEKLIARGTIPRIDFQELVLDEEQLAKHLNILKRRIAQLSLAYNEALKIEEERVKQQESLLNIAQSRVDALVVHAGMDGVLQRLSVEIGQSLNPGQEIALIGSSTDLVALIKVPQSEAQIVVVGQDAIISIREENIKGKVSRIDPRVENNTVNIEISLPEKLPPSALPQLNVDAKIIAETLKHITYIKRPAKAQSNSKTQLYRMDVDQKYAQIQSVQFGRRAGEYIEILSGAKTNDLFITSDLSNLKTTSSQLRIE